MSESPPVLAEAMSDSQKHRAGVSVQRSPSTYFAEKLTKASDLIARLEANPNAATKTTHEIVEILGDLIMSNPLEAHLQDVPSRLWTVCFYDKVKMYRSKISRAKRKKDPELKRLTKQFEKLCDEGTEYYKLLVDHSKGTLKKAMQSQAEDSGSQDLASDSLPEGEVSSVEGVVQCFYKVSLHLGDLYRYSEKFKLSEESYLEAAKLAPGKGNPYNQLAVVTLTECPDLSFNALYWYARSLLATHESFQTTNANLTRMFADNRNYLNEHSRDPKPPILKLEQKRNADILRNQKRAANKTFLAHFVAVIDDILESTKPNVDVNEAAIRSKMSDIMDSFESLLVASTFGDSMLCKMVLICVYAFHNSMDGGTPISKALSRDYLLIFGVSLANRLKAAITKFLDKEKSASLIPPMRLLISYLILCEYMGQITESEGEWYDKFWKSFSEVANLTLQVSRREGIAAESHTDIDGDISVPIKDYQLLRGYRPFAFLYKTYSERQEPFVSPQDAVEALGLLESPERANGADESNLKLSRFLFLCEYFAKTERIPVAFSDDRYSFVEETFQEEDSDEPYDGAAFMGSSVDASDDDDAGDVVIYGTEDGGSDAPLGSSAPDNSATMEAPQPFAGSRNPAEGSQPFAVSRNPAVGSSPVAPAPEVLPSPAVLLPPPGFTAPIANPVNNQVSNQFPPTPTPQYPLDGIYGQVVQGHQMLPTPPPPGMVLQGTTPVQGVPFPNVNGNVPFGLAWQVFGGSSADMQSGNPFANPAPIGFGCAKPATPMFEDQHITPEGTSLLDSALIDSLFLNDCNTSNPWK